MKVGIPKEIKNNENRVGMTPAGVRELINHGHTVLVQESAGEGSGFSDEEYEKVGAIIRPSIEMVYAQSDMIVKVKEPIEPEYPLIRKGQVVFTYFHFASDLPLTKAMMKSRAVCIAYETVQKADRSLPLLAPMSEVAGRMAALNGAYYMQKTKGGKGKLMSGVPGVRPPRSLYWAEERWERLPLELQPEWVPMSLLPISHYHVCVTFRQSSRRMYIHFIPQSIIYVRNFMMWILLLALSLFLVMPHRN